MVTINGLSMTEPQFRILLDALEHHAEVADWFAGEGLEAAGEAENAKMILRAFQGIGQRQGLEV